MGVFVFLSIGYTSLGAAEYFMAILQEDQCRDDTTLFAILTYCSESKRKFASQMDLANCNWY